VLWESRAHVCIETLRCCARTEAAEERRRWREQRATQAAANGSGCSDAATGSEPAGGQAASLVAAQKSAQLAVANFDAEGLSAELETVVQQAALSSAGNAVGENGIAFSRFINTSAILTPRGGQRSWRRWCSRPPSAAPAMLSVCTNVHKYMVHIL